MSIRTIMFMPSIEGGGVEKNFFIISNYLAKYDKVSVVTVSNQFKKKFNKKIKFVSLKSKYWDSLNRRLKYILALILLIKEFSNEKKKIVFCFQANIYAILICKIFSVKIIIRSNSAPIGWSQNLIKRKVFSIVLKFADKIIVNSYDFKKDLKKKFKVNSTCIYNPLDKKDIIKKSKVSKKKLFNKNNGLKIINVGRLTFQKDQMTLLKALNELKTKLKFQAVIMGNGILKRKLDYYIKSHGMSKLVRIISYQINPYPYIKQSNLFILSSSFEGLPNVLLEALVLNKFVISSNCRTGPKEILLNGQGGDLFKVGDYKKLSDLILNYSRNKKNYKKKINFSKTKLYRFDYSLNLIKYHNLLKSIK